MSINRIKILSSLFIVLATLGFTLIVLFGFKPVEAHRVMMHGSDASSTSLTAHQLTFTKLAPNAYWTGKVQVSRIFEIHYICDGASPLSEMTVLGQSGVIARHIHLTCDNQFHTEPFKDVGSPWVQVGVSRPVDAQIWM